MRVYEPGDDVRMIDWNVTARTRMPHVRVHLAERVLTGWVVVDASASMRFGTADRRKADVAEGAALALAHVATRRGNRLGVVAFGGADRGCCRRARAAPGCWACSRSCVRSGSRRQVRLVRGRLFTRRVRRAAARADRRHLRLPRSP